MRRLGMHSLARLSKPLAYLTQLSCKLWEAVWNAATMGHSSDQVLKALGLQSQALSGIHATARHALSSAA